MTVLEAEPLTGHLDDGTEYRPNGEVDQWAETMFHRVFGGEWTAEPRRPDGSRYPSMGLAAAAWIEANTPLQLDAWQVELLRRGFLYDPATNDWVARDVIVVGPEGMGKSAFLAAVVLWMVAGPMVPPVEDPSRFPAPKLPIISAALTLTEHIHDYAEQYVDHGPLKGRVVVENTRIYRADDPSAQAHFPAGSGALQQGGNPRPAIVEEELHVLNAPGVRADGLETIEIYSSKRSKTFRPTKCQRWTITNPDDGDPDSLLGRRWRHVRSVLDGATVDREIVGVHYHAAAPVDLDDPADLRRAIRQANPSSFVDVEAIAAKYERDHQSVPRFARFSLGLFRRGVDAVLPDGTIAAAVDLEVEPPPIGTARRVYGFDGSRNRDSIGIFAATVPDGPDGEVVGWEEDYWERPPEAGDDWRYPRQEVKARLKGLLDDDPEAMLAMDDQWWEDFADELELDYPGRVVRGYQSEGPAAWQTFRRTTIDGRLTLAGPQPVLAGHVRNAREVESRGGATVKLTRYRTDVHIDMLVCATYAVRLAVALALDDDEPTVDEWVEALAGPDLDTGDDT